MKCGKKLDMVLIEENPKCLKFGNQVVLKPDVDVLL